jgi:hypothetical protein
MEINVPISRDNYYKGFLKVINSFLGLTKGELDIVVSMLENNITHLNRESRRIIRDDVHKDQYAFNNMVSTLKKSGTLIKGRDGLMLNPTMINNISNKTIKINFHIQGDKLSEVGKTNELSSISHS